MSALHVGLDLAAEDGDRTMLTLSKRGPDGAMRIVSIVDLKRGSNETAGDHLKRVLSAIPPECYRIGLDRIYDAVDNLLCDGAFTQVNEIFATLLPSDILPTYSVGLLTITAAAREHLPARNAYFEQVRARLIADGEQDPDRVLSGLR